MRLGRLAVFVGIFLVSAWMTRRLCQPRSVFYHLDRPNERSLHLAPRPRTGGLAILASSLAGIAAFQVGEPLGLWSSPVTDDRTVLWVLGMTLIVAVISFWDDRAGVAPGVRLAVHGLAALGVVAGAGLTIPFVPMPLVGDIAFGVAAVPVTILFLIWMANLYNFMDGMDGFAGGMTVMGFGVVGFLAWQGGQPSLAALTLAVSAAAAGFLVNNVPPARIFMGDVGSVSLGFLAGTVIIMGGKSGAFDTTAGLLIFSPFIVDATLTLLTRMARRDRVWVAHRDHYYQRLVVAGWGHRRTVAAEYAMIAACGGAGIAYARLDDPRWRAVLLMLGTLVYIALGLGVRRVERRLLRAHGQADA